RVEHGVHVVPPFFIPDHWERFESMDYGRNHPTAWPVYAVDHDANVVCFDMYYGPGLVSEHAAAIHALRRKWWPRGTPAVCYGPPDMKQKYGFIDPHGNELTIETEFSDHGIGFAAAQNDRRAGYARVEEMLRCRGDRRFPDWHPLNGQPGSPQFFI